MNDPYGKLAELDYETYCKAIEVAATINTNLKSAAAWKKEPEFKIEMEIVKFALHLISNKR